MNKLSTIQLKIIFGVSEISKVNFKYKQENSKQ